MDGMHRWSQSFLLILIFSMVMAVGRVNEDGVVVRMGNQGGEVLLAMEVAS